MPLDATQIRNLVLLGHSGSGKSTLAEALLFHGGAIDRMGNVTDGSTVSDWDEEEIARGISLQLSVAPYMQNGVKVNVVDTPGDPSFQGEVICGLGVAETAVILVDAVAGAEVGTELAWNRVQKAGKPCVIVVNKLDRENAEWERTWESIQTVCVGSTLVPVTIPIGEGPAIQGVVDLVTGKAYMGEDNTEADIPESMQEMVEEFRFLLVEAAAESNDELTEKYLEDEELSTKEVRQGLKEGIAAGGLTPIFSTSALTHIGLKSFGSALHWAVPSADQAALSTADDSESEDVGLHGPLAAQAFKTVIDRYVGRINYLRLYNGTLKKGDSVQVVSTDTEEKIVNLHSIVGKTLEGIEEVGVGDICAVTRLTDLATADSLVDPEQALPLAPIEFPKPLFSMAVTPATKADSAKLGQSLHQVAEEDPTLSVAHVAETKQTLLQGIGDIQVNVAIKRLETKFGVKVHTSIPKVPYMETVQRVGSAQYRHKKQSGGAGQFAEVHMRVEPMERGAGFAFESEVYGGAISSSYLPSIEKGVHQVMAEGVVAGFPAVDLRVVVFDGKEHPVDSKDIAFQIAGREVFKMAANQAGATLLEPIYTLIVSVPESNMGDIMGDLNNRRGRVLGMDQAENRSIVKAEVPFAEIMRYGTDLRSMTQGRGTYEIEFLRYEEVPNHLIAKIVEDNQVQKDTE